MDDAAVTVENMVASTKIADELDLIELAKNLSDTKYQPKVFPGLILHMAEPKVTFLLFSTGTMVLTGAKTQNDIQKAVGKLLDMLRQTGVQVIDTPDVR
ncbi:MAG: TATA-box-binding protein, partial [Thermoplasmatota archaeon]